MILRATMPLGKQKGLSIFLLSLLPGGPILFLVLVVLWMSFKDSAVGLPVGGYTIQNYRELFADPFVFNALANTAAFAAVALIVAFALAVPLAWIVERSDLPGREVIYVLMLISVLVPGIFTAMGWLFMFHPEIGIVNVLLRDLFGLDRSPFNIVSIPGMGLVQGISQSSTAFIILAPAYRAINPVLEEAARSHGMSLMKTIYRVSIPLAWPATLAAAIYVFTTSVGVFEVPAVIGLSHRIFTFSTFVYLEANPTEGLPNYGLVSALSASMIIVALLLTWAYTRVYREFYKYQTIGGQGYTSRLVNLRKKKVLVWSIVGLIFIIGKLLPLLFLAWVAFTPWMQAPTIAAVSNLSLVHVWRVDWSLVMAGTMNTAWVMLIVPFIAIGSSFCVAWVLIRSRFRGKFFVDFMAFLPHPVPNIIFALSAVVVALFVVPRWASLYGTLTIIVVVYSLAWLAFGTRVLTSAMVQIHKDLDDAGYVSGMRPYAIICRILVPLMRPALLNAWLWVALLASREVTMAAILATTRGNMTLPVVTWSYWHSGQMGEASVVALVWIVFLTPLVVVYLRLGRWALNRQAG